MHTRLFLALALPEALHAMGAQSPENHEVLSVRYTLASTSTTLHEPVLVGVSISNNLDHAVRVNLGQNRKQAFEVSIGKPDGIVEVRDIPLHEGVSRSWVVEIAPADAYDETLVLNTWCPFSEIGTYHIKVHLVRVLGSKEELPNSLSSWSTLPAINVLPRDPDKLAALCEELKAKLVNPSSYEEGGGGGN